MLFKLDIRRLLLPVPGAIAVRIAVLRTELPVHRALQLEVARGPAQGRIVNRSDGKNHRDALNPH